MKIGYYITLAVQVVLCAAALIFCNVNGAAQNLPFVSALEMNAAATYMAIFALVVAAVLLVVNLKEFGTKPETSQLICAVTVVFAIFYAYFAVTGASSATAGYTASLPLLSIVLILQFTKDLFAYGESAKKIEFEMIENANVKRRASYQSKNDRLAA